MNVMRGSQYRYYVEQSDLVVAADSAIVWRGRPDGMAVQKVVPLERSPDAIVLFEYSQSGKNRFQNLVRCRPDGQIVWKAELPAGDIEAYVDVEWNSGGLIGSCWSGRNVVVNSATGQILQETFVK